MADINKVINSLNKPKRLKENQWQCCCPSHDDKKQSLTVTYLPCEDKILMHCHAGCDTKDILDRAGLKMEDLCPENRENQPTWRKGLVSCYDYYDEHGMYVASKLRYEGKDFKWRVIDGDRIISYGKPKDIETPLYNLHDLLEHIKNTPNEPVYIVEGEKDCQTLKQFGLTAVTPGASKSWKDYHAKHFKDLKVVIVQDNDAAGEKMTECIVSSIKELASAYKVIVPSDKEHGDVSDYLLNDRHSLDDLKVLEEKIPWTVKGIKEVEGLDLISLSDFMEMDIPPTRWIVKDLISEGVTFISAPPKVGKSWLCLDLAVSVARGGKVLGFQTNKCEAVYLALEDNKSRLQDRLKRYLGNGTPPTGVHLTTDSLIYGKGLIEQLEQLPSTVGLVIIDTFVKVKPLKRNNSDAYDVDSKMLGDFQRLAFDKHLAIVFVHHNRKDAYARIDADPFDCLLGSTALQGACDCMLVIKKNRKKSDQETPTLFATSKDSEEKELSIQFDTTTCRWTNLGDREAYQENKARKEYDTSPAAKVIKRMVAQTGEYVTTMGDLRQLIMDQEREVVGTNEKNLGNIISQWDYFLFEDGIDHEKPTKLSTREGKTGLYHKFKYR